MENRRNEDGVEFRDLAQTGAYLAFLFAFVPWLLLGPASIVFWMPAFMIGMVSLIAIHRQRPPRKGYVTAWIAVAISGAGLLAVVAIPASFFGPSNPPIDPDGLCSNHLHQLGLAVGSYTHEHQGRYPDPDKWPEQLLGYVKSQGIFICPKRTSRGVKRYPVKAKGIDSLAVTYSINERLKGLSVKDVKKPEETVLLFESTGEKLSGGPELVPKKVRHEEKHHLVFRDPYINVLFTDWHVERVPLNEVRKLKWDSR